MKTVDISGEVNSGFVFYLLCDLGEDINTTDPAGCLSLHRGGITEDLEGAGLGLGFEDRVVGTIDTVPALTLTEEGIEITNLAETLNLACV